MAHELSRRKLLVAAAGASALTACRAIGAPRQTSAASDASSVAVTVGMQSAIPPEAVTAFERTHPNIHITTGPASGNLQYQFVELIAGGYTVGASGKFADLTAALRALNVDPSTFLPGAMTFWTNRGRMLAVPCSVRPWGLQWRADAFSAAGLQPPTPDWSFADFRNACSILQALAASGRVKGLRAALGPMTPQGFKGPSGKGNSTGYAGALQYSGLWQGFVRGFGGTVAANGRFTLTTPETVSAIQTLVDLIRECSVPAPDVTALSTDVASTAWEDAIAGLSAMTLAPYGSRLATGFSWARLPRFPVQPVIPVLSTAMALRVQSGTPPLPDAPQTKAAAQFGSWLNAAPATQLTTAAGMAPASSAASVQTAFWKGPGPGNAAALGDWRNFRDMYDGFPVVPSRDVVTDAISNVLENKASLPDALAQAEQWMNAQLGK